MGATAPQAGVDSGLVVGAGGLVVHERNTRLVGLDPADGSARWDVPAGWWPRAIVIAGERCLVLPQDTNQLMCVDLVDHDNRQSFTPAGDRFLVRCGERAVVEIAPATGTGTELVVAAHPLRPVTPQHVGGLLWLPERGPGFTVADPHHDRPLWRIDVGQPLVGQVMAMASCFVLLAITKGTLLAAR